MLLEQQKEVWKKQASRWEHVGPPLRPTEQDGRLMLELAIGTPHLHSACSTIVILGVTPEVVQLNWPGDSKLQAFDISADMIAKVWRPNPRVLSQVSQSRWQSLPLESGSADAVVGDGCLTVLQNMNECREFLVEIARVLKLQRRLVLRCFVRPPESESVDAIIADVSGRRIQHFASLKWRLAMVLCDSESSTVQPWDVGRVFNKLFSDRATLHETTGWPLDTINTIDSYEDMKGYFTFMTLAQIQAVSSPLFEIDAIKHGNYELSERCPAIAFSRLQ